MTKKTRKGMHREDIKAELRKRFGPLATLSIRWGLSRTAIAETLRNPIASQRVEMLIAHALEMKPQDLWPDRWDASGCPLPRCSKSETIRRRAVPASSIREAA